MRGLGATLGLALAAGPVWANDSVASMALGGLQLLRTGMVQMVEEELYIRPDEVRVRYLFRSLMDKPFTTIVAFPLPSVGHSFEMDWVPIPVQDDPNYVGFVTRIDGVEVPLQVESRALVLGLDRTEILQGVGLSLLPFDEGAAARIAALPAPARNTLREAHLIDAEGQPLWVLQTTLWREQTFAPGQDVVVEHSYRPVRGGAAVAPVGNFDGVLDDDDWQRPYAEEARARYCVEPEMEGELSFRRNDYTTPGDRHYSSSDVGYVLTTGAHWAGPIGRFRLVAEVPNEWDSVFLCLPGARRVAPNRIEADLTDFWPEHDLAVLFVHLWGQEIDRED